MDTGNLPIWSIMPALIGAIGRGRNVVLTAPPGSGKSTQVPQAMLNDGQIKGAILVVQPRRVACRAVARRVAEERGTSIGEEVGYIVRYENKSSYETKLLFITDGVLLRFLERDPDLGWVGAVVFDEFHERRANMDLALGLLKLAQQRRSSLRLVAMSATIDAAGVARYLDADTFATEGRSYPVEIVHIATSGHDEAVKRAADQVVRMHAGGVQGDILVFLSGKEEIRRVERLLSAQALEGLVVLPLHGELPKEEQDRVFEAGEGRKVVLATNIAETSVTIPGIRIVIDTGYERRADFDAAFGINCLTLTTVSKASADQRAGRAGREAPGHCVRLWSKATDAGLISFAPVETQRIDLSSVVLTLKALGIIEPLAFDFLDAPTSERLAAAENQLVQFGALGSDRRLTPIGWKMLRLPLPPRYARMVVEAERCGCLNEIATIAALLSGRPVFSGKVEKGEEELEAFEYARDGSSTLFSLLDRFNATKEDQYSAESCERYGMNAGALREAAKLRRKLIHLAGSAGLSKHRRSGNRAAMRRCILSGLVDRVAALQPGGSYLTAQGSLARVQNAEAGKSKFLAAADIKYAKGGQGGVTASLQLITHLDLEMLQQVVPHLIEEVRIPVSLDTVASEFTVREEIRYLKLVLASREKKVDVLEGFQVIAEQAQRAEQHAWFRVQVMPTIGRRFFVMWEGMRVPVTAKYAGPHWASVSVGPPLTIALHERIIQQLSPPQETSLPMPAQLREKVGRTSGALAKLLGRSS